MTVDQVSHVIVSATQFVSDHSASIEGGLVAAIAILSRLFPTKNPQGVFAWVGNIVHKAAQLWDKLGGVLKAVGDLLHAVEAIFDPLIPQVIKPVDPVVPPPVA